MSNSISFFSIASFAIVAALLSLVALDVLDPTFSGPARAGFMQGNLVTLIFVYSTAMFPGAMMMIGMPIFLRGLFSASRRRQAFELAVIAIAVQTAIAFILLRGL